MHASALIDGVLCFLFTCVFYFYFNRIVRFSFVVSVILFKLLTSFLAAMILHTLLQFSNTFVTSVYRSSGDQKFTLIKLLAKNAAALLGAPRWATQGGGNEL